VDRIGFVMQQGFSQVLGQHMRLEQKLTPQLIQSMAILQKPVADLEAYVAEALESNAALEIAEREAPESADDGASEHSERTRTDNELREEQGFARLDRLSRDYRDHDLDWGDRGPMRRGGGEDRDAKMAAMANTEGRSASLQEHLMDQWSLVEDVGEVRRAGEAIINHLDADGYLRVRFDEIAKNARPPLTREVLETALLAVQKLEPTGVGARDVVECLLLQLAASPGDNRIERVLIERHLDDIVHNRLPAAAKATGYSLGEIAEAMKSMRSQLCLHPGYLVGDRSVPRIRPDVIVEYGETGGELRVRLARGNEPDLRVRDDVSSMIRDRGAAKETREFAKRQVDEATAVIDAVNFRRSRLLEVARAVAEKQRDFFDSGPSGLKVFRMSDLADELHCDPSTISRTVAEKYMQTPPGVYPMRYFFTGGTETDDGDSMGWDRVKSRVREIVDAEDKGNPVNDDDVVALLQKEGIDLSRRTVAKYRQQLNIPTARQRKTF